MGMVIDVIIALAYDSYDLNLYDSIIIAMQQFAEEIGEEGENNLMIPLWSKGNNKTAIE
jgi:hypothetical protein